MDIGIFYKYKYWLHRNGNVLNVIDLYTLSALNGKFYVTTIKNKLKKCFLSAKNVSQPATFKLAPSQFPTTLD